MNIFYVRLHKPPPRIEIVLGKLLFRQRFVEVIANSILYRRGEQLNERLNVALAKSFVSKVAPTKIDKQGFIALRLLKTAANCLVPVNSQWLDRLLL